MKTIERTESENKSFYRQEELRQLNDLLNEYNHLLVNSEERLNHWLRRFFRCYIDGSYTGYDHYKRNMDFLEQYNQHSKRDRTHLRMLCRSQFIDFIEVEFKNLSRFLIVKSIKNNIGNLETFNQELEEDFLDLKGN